MPTPLLEKQLPPSSVIWSSHESDISGFTESNIENLISERGISIHQHYYPFVIGKYNFGFLDFDKENGYKISQNFNSILKFMAEKKNEGTLLICNVGDLIDYWIRLESVEFSFIENGFILLNNGKEVIKGFSFFCEEKLSVPSGIELKTVFHEKDYWFAIDLKPKIKYEFLYM